MSPSVFTNLKSSLPPLVPANLPTTDPTMDAQIPEQPIQKVQLPPRSSVFAAAPMQQPEITAMIPQPALQRIPVASRRPQVFASASPLDQEQQHLQGRLGRDYQKDSDPYGSPGNHPGVFGKILHGLSVATGGPSRRAWDEQGLEQRLNELAAENAKNELEGAQAGEAEANAHKIENPPDEFTPVDTSGGVGSFSHQHGTVTPVMGADGKPLMPYVKPGPRQHVFLQGPNNTSIAATFDPQSGTYYDAHDNPIENPAPYEKPSPPQHITVMKDGKAHVMGEDAQGNFTRDLGEAPPNYASMMPMVMGAKTIQVTDPSTGLPIEMGYDLQTGRYDVHQGISGAGPYAHQAQSAAALERMVTNSVLPLLDKMSKAGENGPITGRFQDWLNRDIGNAKPDIAQFHQLMNGVISMLMGMYGFRRQQAVDYMAAQLGARMTPKSMRAALEGITQHANSIIGGGLNPSATGNDGGDSGMPPKNVIDSMKEGQYVHGPGGTYQKKNGKLVVVEAQ